MPNFVENPAGIIAAARRNSITAGETIRFPVSENIPYIMLMNFETYNYSDIISNNNSYTSRAKSGTVVLPLPLQLRDATEIEASSAEGDYAAILSTITDLSNYQSGDSLLSNGRYYASVIQKALGAAAAALADGGNKLGAAIAGGAAGIAGIGTGTTGSLLSGQAINPFETMQFKGVRLKNHAFNWRLSPSSREDSDALAKLINEIKKNMLPKYVGALGPAALAHALLQYPNVAMITFLGINQNYYYKLKPCMITAFEVRYNGGEQLNVFKGGKPVVVELSLGLTELQIHTSEDYGGSSVVVDVSDLRGVDVIDSTTGSLQTSSNEESNYSGGP